MVRDDIDFRMLRAGDPVHGVGTEFGMVRHDIGAVAGLDGCGFTDPELVRRMEEKLSEALKENEAPPEQWERLGLEK